MACFIVPTVVGGVANALKKRLPGRMHVDWLTAMTFGGAAGLAIEHIAHREIVFWPPFLTAMGSPAGTAAMLGEMAAVGIPMTLALVAVWAVMVVAYEKFLAKSDAPIRAAATD